MFIVYKKLDKDFIARTVLVIDKFIKPYRLNVLCGHKLLSKIFRLLKFYVSTRDPSSVIFLLKNYICVFTKAKNTGVVQYFLICAFVTLPGT
jgi:hypothetical protein